MKHTRQIANASGQNMAPTRMGMLTVLLLLCMSGTAMHAEASDKKASREREALRRVQQQLSQVQGEMTAIEQEKSRLMADLEQARASSSSVESKAARLQHGLNASKQQLSALTHELVLVKEGLATTARQLDETRKTLDETAQALQQTKAEKNHLEGIKARNERELASCERKNVALYGVGRSLMDRFESKTCGETLVQKEPFTGLKQVETENLLEEYRDKLDDQKYIKAPDG
jgi:septal ring factor EnvC (AmiA/AmiB activator)